MLNFYPVKTEDGSISLFNTVINDIYHSKIGAITEALNKFVKPSGILEFVQANSSVNILDTSFGLGYNSRVAITEILKINPECKINLTGIEIDPQVLAFSFFINYLEENEIPKYIFHKLLYEWNELKIHFKNIINDVTLKANFEPDYMPFFRDFENQEELILQKPQSGGLLHNIYYQSIPIRNKINHISCYKSENINITLHICDTRDVVLGLNTYYDFIFHDPFTPSKAPVLWSVELFRELFKLLNYNGNLTTYSSSAAIRSGLCSSWFFCGQNRTHRQKVFRHDCI